MRIVALQHLAHGVVEILVAVRNGKPHHFHRLSQPVEMRLGPKAVEFFVFVVPIRAQPLKHIGRIKDCCTADGQLGVRARHEFAIHPNILGLLNLTHDQMPSLVTWKRPRLRVFIGGTRGHQMPYEGRHTGRQRSRTWGALRHRSWKYRVRPGRGRAARVQALPLERDQRKSQRRYRSRRKTIVQTHTGTVTKSR